MNPNDEKTARAMRDFPVPPPPAGLLEKIQAEILRYERALEGVNA